jgi:tetratricopeptide (TPR) repeat protein
MSLRLLSALAIVSCAALGLSTAPWAQQPLPDPSDPNPHEGIVQPPEQLPKLKRGERSIDFLFGALKVAPDDASAKAVEERIWAVWTNAGNETTIFLMDRAKKAMDEKDYDLALRLLSAIIEIRPDYIEAWNRRATVYFLKREYRNSLADIAKVLSREPRHFGALSGLGLIMQDMGDDKHALEAYRKALEIYPRLNGIGEKVKALTEKVEGRDI